MAANVKIEICADEILPKLFESASNFVRKVSGNLTAENLLYFYSRFKQANEGKCNTPKPYFFDIQGKQKWESWKKLGDMSQDTAMKEYVNYLTQCYPAWQTQIAQGGGGEGLGIAVSRMIFDEESLDDCDKTVFDWCKEGEVKQVSKILRGKFDINQLDEEGMGLLHWACDRGLDDMVKLLLQHKANQNIQDSDGQTPLHYAVDCQHKSVVKILLDNQVNIRIKDSEGIAPLDIETSSSIKTLLDIYGKKVTN